MRDWISSTSSRICCWIVTSKAVVGSSAMSKRGEAQRDGYHHPLHHAPRKFVRERPAHPLRAREAHLAQDLLAASQSGAPVDTMGAQSFHDLRADPQERVQRGHRVLVDHGDLGPSDLLQALVVEPAEILACEMIAPSKRTGGSGRSRSTESTVRLLPEPLSPDDAELLAREYVQVHPADDLVVADGPGRANAHTAKR